MKTVLLSFFMLCIINCKAQSVEKIFVNLYTDSLKKGTLNYINIDGQLTNGKFIPLDSTKILFECPQAKFKGNSLFIPTDFTLEKVVIKTTLKSNPTIFREFEVFIKKMEDPVLKDVSEIKIVPAAKAKKKKSRK